MLSLRSCRNELVTVIIHEHSITLHWITVKKNALQHPISSIGELKACMTIDAPYALPCSNLTAMQTHLHDFIQKHNIRNAALSFAVNGPSMLEQFASSATAHPAPETFALVTPKHMLWDYTYLYPNEQNAFIFYLCGISQQHVLQYKLLAIKSNLPLRAIMSKNMALIQLYRSLQGPAFRHSQLAVCLTRAQHNVDQLFTNEIIHRLLAINPAVSLNFTQQAPLLRTTLGLALTSGDIR